RRFGCNGQRRRSRIEPVERSCLGPLRHAFLPNEFVWRDFTGAGTLDELLDGHRPDRLAVARIVPDGALRRSSGDTNGIATCPTRYLFARVRVVDVKEHAAMRAGKPEESHQLTMHRGGWCVEGGG